MSSSLSQESTGGGGPRKSLFVRYGDFVFKHRDKLFPLALAAIFIAFPPRAGASLGDLPLDVFGLALVAAGLILRGAVIGLAYIKRGGLKKKVYAEHLVTDGFFAHCRNPLYVGNILVAAGFFVIVNNPWTYIVGGGFLLLSYAAIVAAEEHYLRAKYGAGYEAYCRDVSRWWIDPRGLGQTFSRMRFNWRRVVLKDYSTVTTSVAIAVGLLGYEAVRARGFEAASGTVWTCAAAAFLLILAAIAVHLLKKARVLTLPKEEPAE